jgi:hypothetical protein
MQKSSAEAPNKKESVLHANSSSSRTQKLQTTPIFGRFPREKKSSVTQTSKQASKQDSTLDQRQDTKNPSTKATAIRELGATRRRRRRRRSDACWD